MSERIPHGVPTTGSSRCIPEPDGSCSICGDEGLEARVLEAGSGSPARVRLADGAVREVATDLVGEVRPGDRLVIHMGFAIGKIREEPT